MLVPHEGRFCGARNFALEANTLVCEVVEVVRSSGKRRFSFFATLDRLPGGLLGSLATIRNKIRGRGTNSTSDAFRTERYEDEILQKLAGCVVRVGEGLEKSKRTTLRHWNQGCNRVVIATRTRESGGRGVEQKIRREQARDRRFSERIAGYEIQ